MANAKPPLLLHQQTGHHGDGAACQEPGDPDRGWVCFSGPSGRRAAPQMNLEERGVQIRSSLGGATAGGAPAEAAGGQATASDPSPDAFPAPQTCSCDGLVGKLWCAIKNLTGRSRPDNSSRKEQEVRSSAEEQRNCTGAGRGSSISVGPSLTRLVLRGSVLLWRILRFFPFMCFLLR